MLCELPSYFSTAEGLGQLIGAGALFGAENFFC